MRKLSRIAAAFLLLGACTPRTSAMTSKDLESFGARYAAAWSDGLIAESKGHYDEAEYQRQLKVGAP